MSIFSRLVLPKGSRPIEPATAAGMADLNADLDLVTDNRDQVSEHYQTRRKTVLNDMFGKPTGYSL